MEKFRVAGFARFQSEDNVQDLQGTDTVQPGYADSEYMELEEGELQQEDEMFQGRQESKEGIKNWDRKAEASSASMGEDDKKNKKLLPDIPKNLEVALGQPRVKGVKNFFYCQLCKVELNSMETMISHQQGIPHSKKVQLFKDENPESSQLEFIEQIPVPHSGKTKKLKRLHERIRDSKDPIIGLQFIKEFLPESNLDMEPHYECLVCGNKGTSNSMLSHLHGISHNRKVAERMGFNIDLGSKGDLNRFVRENYQNGEPLSKLIKTVRSDQSYPWPAGKAPWSRERGGTGYPPREEAGSHPEAGSHQDIKRRRMNHPGVKLPHPDSVEKPQTDAEAEKMIEIGKKLFELAMESEFANLSEDEKQKLKFAMQRI